MLDKHISQAFVNLFDLTLSASLQPTRSPSLLTFYFFFNRQTLTTIRICISYHMTPNLVAKQITNSSTLTCHRVLLLVVVQLLRSIQIQYKSISIENLMLLEHKMIPFFFRQIVWKCQIKHIACGVFAWKSYIGPKMLKQKKVTLVQKCWNNWPFFQFRLKTDYADIKFIYTRTEWNLSDLDVNKEKAGFCRQHSGKEDVVKPGSVIASRREQW